MWRLRGPYPGLGAALTAFGIPGERSSPTSWSHPPARTRIPGPGSRRGWKTPPRGRWVIAGRQDDAREVACASDRSSRAPHPAVALRPHTDAGDEAVPADGAGEGPDRGSDRELLENPYLLYEVDRSSLEPVAVGAIDRGTLPDDAVRDAHPVPEPSALDDATDPRRVRAFVVSYLEARSADGHTLQPAKEVVQAMRDMAVSPACPVDADPMSLVKSRLDPVVDVLEMLDRSPAYQLRRLSECGDLIRSAIERRLKGARLDVEADWAALLADALPGGIDEAEERAREEKCAALKELTASRLPCWSVLPGLAR